MILAGTNFVLSYFAFKGNFKKISSLRLFISETRISKAAGVWKCDG